MSDQEPPATRFSTSLRGYSPAEVDRYVALLTRQIEELEAERARLLDELEEARAQPAREHSGVDVLAAAHPYDERVAAVEALLVSVAAEIGRRVGLQPPEPEPEPEPEAVEPTLFDRQALPDWHEEPAPLAEIRDVPLPAEHDERDLDDVWRDVEEELEEEETDWVSKEQPGPTSEHTTPEAEPDELGLGELLGTHTLETEPAQEPRAHWPRDDEEPPGHEEPHGHEESSGPDEHNDEDPEPRRGVWDPPDAPGHSRPSED